MVKNHFEIFDKKIISILNNNTKNYNKLIKVFIVGQDLIWEIIINYHVVLLILIHWDFLIADCGKLNNIKNTNELNKF